jgi:hypothetical protein
MAMAVLGGFLFLFSGSAMAPLFSVLGIGVDIHEITINEIEDEVGKPCSEVYEEAMGFVRGDLHDIVNVGLADGDWIKVITEDQKVFIHRTEERVRKCQHTEFSAAEKGYDWPEFSELVRLFGTLRMHTTSYTGEEPASTRLKNTVLQRVIENRNTLIKGQRNRHQ